MRVYVCIYYMLNFARSPFVCLNFFSKQFILVYIYYFSFYSAKMYKESRAKKRANKRGQKLGFPWMEARTFLPRILPSCPLFYSTLAHFPLSQQENHI